MLLCSSCISFCFHLLVPRPCCICIQPATQFRRLCLPDFVSENPLGANRSLQLHATCCFLFGRAKRGNPDHRRKDDCRSIKMTQSLGPQAPNTTGPGGRGYHTSIIPPRRSHLFRAVAVAVFSCGLFVSSLLTSSCQLRILNLEQHASQQPPFCRPVGILGPGAVCSVLGSVHRTCNC